MKAFFFLLLSFVVILSIANFRRNEIIDNTNSENSSIASKKKFTIRCSPDYLPSDNETIPMLSGWGNYQWKVSTISDSAQFYFNQGINMYYAFHIIESRASFDKASKFDPYCAMAWWGKALAFGPNINDFGYKRPNEAFASSNKALELIEKSTAFERALIDAISVRYSADSLISQDKLNVLYTHQMNKVYLQFYKNENAGALYADALLLLHPWNLYNHDFSPKSWTPEIVSVLKHTLQLNSKHPGANHYFIHAVEASAHPQDALKSAKFLATAMPDVSHITHMPSHIYIRSGYYNEGINVNEAADKGFNKYLGYFPTTQQNIALYSLHNLHMKLNCAQMAGNYKKAIEASEALQSQIPSFYLQIPGALGNYVQYLHQSSLFTHVRFGKWKEILSQNINDSLANTAVLQHFARGMALVKTNQLAGAKEELNKMQTLMQVASLKEVFTPFNSAYDASRIGENILKGTIAEKENNKIATIKYFKIAVDCEDKLIYNEPRDWLLPARQYLGNALLRFGRYSEAISIFQKDLFTNPNNGWSLTGLSACYRSLNQSKKFHLNEKKIKAAWVGSDVTIVSAVY